MGPCRVRVNPVRHRFVSAVTRRVCRWRHDSGYAGEPSAECFDKLSPRRLAALHTRPVLALVVLALFPATPFVLGCALAQYTSRGVRLGDSAVTGRERPHPDEGPRRVAEALGRSSEFAPCYGSRFATCARTFSDTAVGPPTNTTLPISILWAAMPAAVVESRYSLGVSSIRRLY